MDLKGLRRWHPTPVLLPGKSHGWRSLVGCSPWGCKESDTTEQLHFDFSLSCIEEGNGNPLQCSCLENPRDGGAWWAAVSGVAQSRTRLKRLSSSTSSSQWSRSRCFSGILLLSVIQLMLAIWSGSSAFSKFSFYIWKFSVYILLKPNLKNFGHDLASMWNECNCIVFCTFFFIALLWDWNEKWTFPVLWVIP